MCALFRLCVYIVYVFFTFEMESKCFFLPYYVHYSCVCCCVLLLCFVLWQTLALYQRLCIMAGVAGRSCSLIHTARALAVCVRARARTFVCVCACTSLLRCSMYYSVTSGYYVLILGLMLHATYTHLLRLSWQGSNPLRFFVFAGLYSVVAFIAVCGTLCARSLRK